MDEKRVVSKYLEYRENVLKYTNIDMNLELENDEQVLKSMQLVDVQPQNFRKNRKMRSVTGEKHCVP